MKKRILCVLLALCVMLTLTPGNAFAKTPYDKIQKLGTEHFSASNSLNGDPAIVSVGKEYSGVSLQSSPDEQPLPATETALTTQDAIIDALRADLDSDTQVVSYCYRDNNTLEESACESLAYTLALNATREAGSVVEGWAPVCYVYSEDDDWCYCQMVFERTEYHTTLEDAAAVFRAGMKNRHANIMVYVQAETAFNFTVLFKNALNHTGVPTEGDYLRWQWKTIEESSSVSGYKVGEKNYWVYSINIIYYTTAEQENEVTEFVVDFMTRDAMKAARTDYEKVKVIYDWLCENVDYDHEHDNSYKLKYTAYAAVNGLCVCQGYALLFYRLVLTCGIDNRLIAGDGGGPHAWNAVRLGSQYYLVDSTWDAPHTPDSYLYFLRGTETFSGHTQYTDNTKIGVQYDPSSMYDVLGVSTADYAVPLYSDLTGDGAVDPSDMQALYEYLCGGTVTIAYRANDRDFLVFCDCNNDGEINILDYQALYDDILAKK